MEGKPQKMEFANLLPLITHEHCLKTFLNYLLKPNYTETLIRNEEIKKLHVFKANLTKSMYYNTKSANNKNILFELCRSKVVG